MRTLRGYGGFTLIELIVVVAMLGVYAGVVTASLVGAGQDSAADAWKARMDSACVRAIDQGVATIAWPDSAQVESPLLFLSDGRVAAPEPFEVVPC